MTTNWALLRDLVFLTVTVAAEASSEGDECMRAVAASVRNRLLSGRFEPTLAGVCAQRYQYSEYLPDKGDNANLERVLNLPEDAPEIVAALAAVDAVMADETLDPSQGATHFYAAHEGWSPPWAVPPARETIVIGCVHFWTNVP